MDVASILAVLFDLDGTLVTATRLRRGRIDSDVVDAVRAIATRYRVGVVSDGGAERQRDKLRATGLAPLMSTVVISGEHRAQKPSRRIFAIALAALRCAPDRVLFVGDDLRRDIAGASHAGMRACWVTNGRSSPTGGPRPDIEVDSVVALREVLRC